MRKIIQLQKLFLETAIILLLILGNSQFSYSLGELKTAKIQLRLYEKDSIKMVEAKVNKITDGKIGDPVARIEVKFYVERTFSLLPFGGRYTSTDDSGRVEVEFPKDLPGDSAGFVHVIAKISDSEEYKDTETGEILKWGIPTHLKDATLRRSIWAAAANAPIPLLILVNSMIFVVWVLMFYIVFRLYKISKM
jgi:hypothetical protein